MTRSSLQAFAAGIFLSACVLAGYQFFFKNDETISLKEAKTIISQHGFKIIDKNLENDRKQTKPAEGMKPAIKKADKDHSNKPISVNQNENNDHVISYTLTIKSGTTPGEVSQTLEKEKVIKDSSQLNQYMEKHNLSRSIQLGSYILTNNMTLDQIARTITH